VHAVNRDTKHIDIVYFSLCMNIFILQSITLTFLTRFRMYAFAETTELYIQFVPFCSTWYDW